MRRRFGRRRGGNGPSGIDAAGALARIREAEVVEAASLEPVEIDGIPASLAALGQGETPDGRPLLVAFSPRGGDALLAALAAGGTRAEQGAFERGLVVAVAPVWTAAARRRLSLAAPQRFQLEVRELPALAESGSGLEPERADTPAVTGVEAAIGQVSDARQRDLFARAAAGLAGLAAKHGGGVRGVDTSVELVLQAWRVARVKADASGIGLETLLPRRSTDRLSDESLADALDRLEGQLRKRLNDRRLREGEEGMRARTLADVAEAAELHGVVRWPLPGSDPEALDFAGLDAEGKPVAGAIRTSLDLPALGAILDAALALPSVLPALMAGVAAPVRIQLPRILVSAESFDDAVMRALSEISLEVERVPLRPGALARETVNAGRESSAGGRRESGRRSRGRGRGRGRGRRGDGRGDAEEASGETAGEEAPAAALAAGDEGEGEPEPRRFDEISAFDLDDGSDDEPRRRGRRRGGRRRREGRRSNGSGGRETEGEDADAEPAEPSAADPAPTAASERDDEVLEIDEEDLGLAEDVPDPDAVAAAPTYDDEEETAADVSAEERERSAREAGRAEPDTGPAAPPERPRRAVVVAHADRGSLAAALLLAREARVLEGLWVYPQSELMTFFRSVATDIREDTPIYVVGFQAKPAVEVLQAVGLYQGRLAWFDHHAWPPEDRDALRRVIGEDSLHVEDALDSPLPLVLRTCTRRSRFSDKLVDLVTARFTEHDFTRWGRVWWAKLGAILERPGERKSEIDPLLAGRPSDLAKQASRAPTPEAPPELAYVTEHDFALAHFGGYSLVQASVPAELDLHMTGRIARERYAAQLSLTWWEGGDVVVLGGDEGGSKRGIDLQSMVEHLANKHAWLDALPGHDHVARFRIHDFPERPERIDAVVAEIAMGRSILEG